MTMTPPTFKQVYHSTISTTGMQRRSWPVLAGTLVFACWAALMLPAAVSAAPPEPSPEPTAPAPSATPICGAIWSAA